MENAPDKLGSFTPTFSAGALPIGTSRYTSTEKDPNFLETDLWGVIPRIHFRVWSVPALRGMGKH